MHALGREKEEEEVKSTEAEIRFKRETAKKGIARKARPER